MTEAALDRSRGLELAGTEGVNRPGPFLQCPRLLGIRFRAQPADEPAVSAASSGGPA